MKILCLILLLLNASLALWEWRSAEPSTSAANSLPPFLLVGEYRTALRGTAISSVFDAQVAIAEQALAIDFVDRSRRLAGNARTIDALLRAKAKPAIEPLPKVSSTPAPTPSPSVKPTPTVTPKPRIVATPIPTVSETVKAGSEIGSGGAACYQVGPFADQAGLTVWLKSQGLKEIASFSEETELPVDYQVFYPAAKSPEQQRLNKMMLNEKGVVDLWTVPSGENKGALSLGVFTSIERANVYRQELLNKGIKAEVKQRFKPVSRFYANIILNKDRHLQLRNRGATNLSPCR